MGISRRQRGGRRRVGKLSRVLFADLPDRGQKAGQDVVQRGPVFGGDATQQRDGVWRDRGIDGGLAAEAGGKAQADQQRPAGQGRGRGVCMRAGSSSHPRRIPAILVIPQTLQELMGEIGPAGVAGRTAFFRGRLRDGLVLGHGRSSA